MTDDNRSSASDPLGDFQRWLMRSSARSLGRELKGQARRTFGGGSSRDVWETATAEPVPAEAPECAWCPVCRAARRLRQSGPGLASHVSGAGDALLTAAQDTLAAFEATLSARPPEGWRGSPAGPERSAGSSEGTGWPAEADPGPAQAPAQSAEPRSAEPGAARAPAQSAAPGAAEASPAQAAEPWAAHAGPVPSAEPRPAEASPAQAAEPEADASPPQAAGPGAAEASPSQAAESEAAGASPSQAAGPGAADLSPSPTTAEAAEAREGQSAASDEPDRRS